MFACRAKEALTDAKALLKDINGDESKESLTASINLSNVHKGLGDVSEAEELLVSALDTARRVHGDMSALTATILNNMGLLLKRDSARQSQAKRYYEEALRIRSYTLGNQHPDTIISMNNLAELHLALGEEKEATALQESILELVGAKEDEEKEVEALNEKLREMKANKKGAADPAEWRP